MYAPPLIVSRMRPACVFAYSGIATPRIALFGSKMLVRALPVVRNLLGSSEECVTGIAHNDVDTSEVREGGIDSFTDGWRAGEDERPDPEPVAVLSIEIVEVLKFARCTGNPIAAL
ncbi:MAG: hypothetical protein JWP08_3249 [Bryobacterales bacterium]|nr:hypothetical protein [Bryobacterales bacterium]